MLLPHDAAMIEQNPVETPGRHAAAHTVRRAIVVINGRAGAVLQRGAAHFRKMLEGECARHGIGADVRIVAARRLRDTLRDALARRDDLVILAGGDGTISHMLPLMIEAGGPVGILPLGTLNLLGHDIGLTEDIPASISRLVHLDMQPIDLGSLNGRPFHSISGIGFFGMMAKERETARRTIPFSKTLGFLWAALRTLLFTRTMAVDVVIKGETRSFEADAVLVTNNRFEGTPWRRATISDGLLEVHTFRAHGLVGRIKAVIAVARGRWRELSTLETVSTPSVTLRRRDRQRTIVSTDGERHLVRGPLHYRVLPGALTLVVARSQGEGADSPAAPHVVGHDPKSL